MLNKGEFEGGFFSRNCCSFHVALIRNNSRVLIPGSGLGRLVWESAFLGFDAQGNEFSYFMLLASFLLLNGYQQTISFLAHLSFFSPPF